MSDYCATPEERQEVAAKLRKNSTAAYSAEEALRIICKCTVRAMRGSKSVMEVLADLIDPTCELDLDFGMEYIVCQSCGYELPHGTHLDETKYCPNCGSRVVVSKDE